MMRVRELISFIDDTIVNFIFGSIIFIGLNIFEDIENKKHTCPTYCDVSHHHNYPVVKKDE